MNPFLKQTKTGMVLQVYNLRPEEMERGGSLGPSRNKGGLRCFQGLRYRGNGEHQTSGTKKRKKATKTLEDLGQRGQAAVEGLQGSQAWYSARREGERDPALAPV